MTDVEQLDAAEAVRDDRSGTTRVVLRGVRVIVLDDLTPDEHVEIAGVLGAEVVADSIREAWMPVASRSGAVEAAVKSYAGQSGAAGAKAGTYKAVPHASWFVPPMVIEPPLP